MKKTTLYLPDDLKQRVEEVARKRKQSEANVIRDAIAAAVDELAPPRPTIPLTYKALGDHLLSERVNEALEDFGK